MESKENSTHSAFLSELLNPEGSHQKGNTFLKLFLEVINVNNLDASSAKVKVEHYIGERNDALRTGGRIDIFIKDKNGNSISIENKIYANDQFAQIQRYCNYNTGCNFVYYLTLWGHMPTGDSCGSLQPGKDFWVISYRKHIMNWLEKCHKESAGSPILRETIKQYILLIKKLTHSMDDPGELELFDLIINNYEEAAFHSANFSKAIARFNDRFRKEVMKSLKNELEADFDIALGSGTESAYSQIWIRLKGKESNKLFFGIQSFAAGNNEPFPLFIGIFKGLYREEYAMLGDKRSNWWTAIHKYSQIDDITINFSDSEFLKRLSESNTFYKCVLDHIVTESIQYINTHRHSVASFLAENQV